MPSLGLAAVVLATAWLVLALAGNPGPHLPVPLGRPGLLVAGKDGEILLIDPTGQIVNRHPTGDQFGAGAWSHDGTRLAHAEGSVEHPDLVITDEHLTEELRIPLPGATVPLFSWSPNDQQIAFGVQTDTEAQVYVVDVAADAKPKAITDIARDAMAPSWSPDGALIAFRGGVKPEDVAVYTVHPDGTGLTRLSHRSRIDEAAAPWTPDGRSILSRPLGRLHAVDVDRWPERAEVTPGAPRHSARRSRRTEGIAARLGAAQSLRHGHAPDGTIVTPTARSGTTSPPSGRPTGGRAMNGRSINGRRTPRAFLDPRASRRPGRSSRTTPTSRLAAPRPRRDGGVAQADERRRVVQRHPRAVPVERRRLRCERRLPATRSAAFSASIITGRRCCRS